MKKLSCLFTLVIFLVPSLNANSIWGQNGHRIVAKICYDNLSPKAKLKVDEVLGNNLLEQVSTWADYIKSEDEWDFAKPWHYMTVQPNQTLGQVVEKNSKKDRIDDVYEGILFMKSILEGDKKATERFEKMIEENRARKLENSTQATALALLIHFIGDVHQPMHVGKNRDLGGNKISVLFFDKRWSLHALWDTAIIEQEDLSYTEFAAFIETHQRMHKEQWEKDGIDVWINESIQHRETIYNTLYDGRTDRDSGLPDLSYQYQHDFLPLLEARIAAAGYRAAALLNGIYQ